MDWGNNVLDYKHSHFPQFFVKREAAKHELGENEITSVADWYTALTKHKNTQDMKTQQGQQ